MSAADDAGFAERLRRIESLVAAVEDTADPAAQANARELLRAVLELHARGIARILEIGGAELTKAVAADALGSSLLLLHDLHPLDLEERVRQAIETARPHLEAEGCSVELEELTEGVVRVRLERSTYGHHTTADALRQKLADAIWELAPDAEDVEFTGTIEQGRPQAAHAAAPLVKLGVPEAARGGAA